MQGIVYNKTTKEIFHIVDNVISISEDKIEGQNKTMMGFDDELNFLIVEDFITEEEFEDIDDKIFVDDELLSKDIKNTMTDIPAEERINLLQKALDDLLMGGV